MNIKNMVLQLICPAFHLISLQLNNPNILKPFNQCVFWIPDDFAQDTDCLDGLFMTVTDIK